MSLYRTGCPLSERQADHQTFVSSKTPSQDQLKYPCPYEDGRPFASDTLTGRQTCLCGLDLDPTRTSRLPQVGAPIKVFSNLPTPSTTGLEFDPPVFYSPLFHRFPIRAGRPSPLLPSGVIGQPLLLDAKVPDPRYGLLYHGIEVGNSALRKAATRETTGPLKAWLGEHKKNPYPTKAEKIMLAIITKMTLTQVSTWFANARRRLKKENITYSPRIGGQDKDDNEEDDDVIDDDHDGDLDIEDKKDAAVSYESNRGHSEPAFTQGLSSTAFDSPEIIVDSADTESDESGFELLRSKLFNDNLSLDSANGPQSWFSINTAPRPSNFHHRLKIQSWSPFSPDSNPSYSPFASNIFPVASPSDTISPSSLGKLQDPKTNSKEWKNYRNSVEATESMKGGFAVSKSTDDKHNIKKSKIWSISEIINEQPPKSSSETDKHRLAGRDGFPRHFRGFSPTTLFTSSNSHTSCSPSHYSLDSFSNYSSTLTSSSALTPVPKEGPPLGTSPQFSSTTNCVSREDMTAHDIMSKYVVSPFSLLASPMKAEAFFRLHRYTVPDSNFLERRRIDFNYMHTSDQGSETPSALHLSPISSLHSNGLNSYGNRRSHNHAHIMQQERGFEIDLSCISDQSSPDDMEQTKNVHSLRTSNAATNLVTPMEDNNLVTPMEDNNLVTPMEANNLVMSNAAKSLRTSNVYNSDTTEKRSDSGLSRHDNSNSSLRKANSKFGQVSD